MKTLLKLTVAGAILCMLFQVNSSAQDENSPYRVTDEQGNTGHIFPTPSMSGTIAAPSGALSYHGGPIMPSITTYVIFWVPPRLQNGNPTSLSAKYESVVKAFMGDYPGHGIANNSTQYYSVTGGVQPLFPQRR